MNQKENDAMLEKAKKGWIAPPVFSTSVTLFKKEQNRAGKFIRNQAEIFRGMHIPYSSPLELAGLPDKVRIAERIINGSETPNDRLIIQTEILSRNRKETIDQLAKKQINKAKRNCLVRAVVDGTQKNSIELLRNAKTAKQLKAVCAKFFKKIETAFAQVNLK